MISRLALFEFLRAQKWAVEASVAANGSPQAAVIGVAIANGFELVFDTMGDTRKASNLRRDPRIALVLGWDEGQTVQFEGLVDEPGGDELARLKAVYFAKFPDGPQRESWPGISYFRVKPVWLRYSDFRGSEPKVLTFDGASLRDFDEAAARVSDPDVGSGDRVTRFLG